MLCSENATWVITTESQIAAPPSMAVGFLCHRSVLGTAIKPKRRATALTRGVSISAKQRDAATARSVRGLNGIKAQTTSQTTKDFWTGLQDFQDLQDT